MLYYNFKNYEEFKELFGVRVCADGNKSRSNKILLGCLKDKILFHDFVHGSGISNVFAEKIFSAKSNEDALGILVLAISTPDFLKDQATYRYIWNIAGYEFFHGNYKCDENNGLCIDKTDNNRTGYVRYVNVARGNAFKMKAGKFMHDVLMQYHHIPLPLMRYLEEKFAREWTAHTSEFFNSDKYKLVVDDDFEMIYNGYYCPGDFGSCMTNKDYHHFYENAVSAKAASLRNDDGKIVARCVIYMECYDEDGNEYRLAERQYATGKSDLLKLQLVNALISGGHIDGYKRVGAGCSDADDFIDIYGNSLKEKVFHIHCYLEEGDALSYQDSFKWYDYGSDIAYNDEDCDYSDELDTTDGYFRDENHDDDLWSEYHQCYIRDDDAYHVETRNDYFYRDEVVCIHGEYYFKDDCNRCDYCGEWYYAGDDCCECSYYSDLTDLFYCSDYCRESDEQEYIEDNDLERCEYDEEYHPSCDMVNVLVYDRYTHSRILERWYKVHAQRRLDVVYFNGNYYRYFNNGAIPMEFDLSSEIEMWAA